MHAMWDWREQRDYRKLRRAPERCGQCDNTGFEEPTTLGTVHNLVNQFVA